MGKVLHYGLISLAIHGAVGGGLYLLTHRSPQVGPRVQLWVEIGEHPEGKRGQPLAAKRTRAAAKTPAVNANSAAHTPDAAAPPQDVEEATGSAGGGLQDAALAAYIAQVARALDAQKFYPRDALFREEEGRVLVALTILSNGQVESSRIEASSGFPSLDQAALQAVGKVGPFSPLPHGQTEALHIHVPIEFSLGR